MSTYTISPVLSWGQFTDSNGDPLNGGKLYAYLAGSSSVLAPTYTLDTGSPIQNANPLTLDSSGRLPTSVWLVTDTNYHLVLTQSDGTTVIEEFDYVTGAPSSAWVQDLIDTELAAYVPLTGGAITGNISVSGSATLNTVNATTLSAGATTLGATTATSLTATLDANSAVISNVATPVADTDAATKAYADTAGTSPAGAVMMFAGTTAPSGWLFCNGASLVRADYANLFAAIGTTYGFADGTHFNLPDLRGQFVRGWDDSAGVDTGRVFGSTQADALQNITGSFALDGDLTSSLTGAFYAGATGAIGLQQNFSPSVAATFDASRVARTSTETRPTNVAMNYIIKA